MDKLPEYLRDTVDWFMGKARKRDRECMGSDNERKLYLQDPLLELRIPETEINFLLDLPGGLDYNEWLASHSNTNGWMKKAKSHDCQRLSILIT